MAKPKKKKPTNVVTGYLGGTTMQHFSIPVKIKTSKIRDFFDLQPTDEINEDTVDEYVIANWKEFFTFRKAAKHPACAPQLEYINDEPVD